MGSIDGSRGSKIGKCSIGNGKWQHVRFVYFRTFAQVFKAFIAKATIAEGKETTLERADF